MLQGLSNLLFPHEVLITAQFSSLAACPIRTLQIIDIVSLAVS